MIAGKYTIMSVSLTENAARRVQNLLAKRGGIGLRLAIKTAGCSGMTYALEFADAAGRDELKFESHGVTLLIDPKSLPYLEGTEVDFVREGLNESFRFNNPNVKSQCGCGESFAV